jgi:ribosomal protein S18 acetylase RimI-like enzyme
MNITVREAAPDDVDDLVALYRGLEEEMTVLHPMWPLADGLGEPVVDSLRAAIADPDTVLLIGELEGVPVGFLMASVESMLAQAGEERVGAIRLIYVERDAREVAVGEEMRESVMDLLRRRGITRFDAYVLPGHRLAKNFFESGGFAARSIVMHHDDRR